MEAKIDEPWIACPYCGKSDSLSTVETLTGTARFTPGEPGEMDYDGEIKIDWEGQETVTNERGELLFCCHDCLAEWYQALPEVPGGTEGTDGG